MPTTNFPTEKLQHAYKHAADFGVDGNWNSLKATEYQRAIENHMNNDSTQVFKSQYRGNEIYAYINKDAGLISYTDMQGNYIGGWRYSESQLQYHLANGTQIK